ncbi:MAG: hypothetical protein HOW97_14420 [Catenulispora sp.]|nr:hypothetical protein [Catenulispora sp.]NUR61440.1 hypothetical protein [Catenulispora sp.]
MAASDPYIQSLARRHHLHPAAGPGSAADDLAVRALTAEMRHLAVRVKIAGTWTVENFTPGGAPKAGAEYRPDAYIRSLLDRHRLADRPGESASALTRRAMLGDIKTRSHAAQAATSRRLRGPQPRP